MSKVRTTEPPQQATPPPRKYIGPTPPATISNLTCGCQLPADQLDRAQQDFLIETVPHAAEWYEEIV